ncbi:hypothetical protein PQQ51_06710 [Paraburkholderia xenovorans]|uniref:hypothetical protein n=1 Tax=Paraburkholderia xenovorans TaxID=36873 RepID=UPI0038BA4D04
MIKTNKPTIPSQRPPVDALQYEKLALATFHAYERHIDQLDKLATLTASIRRTPILTTDERTRQHNLLELMLGVIEQYARDLECDRELYQVIALDARGIAHSRITSKIAANLLAEAAGELEMPRSDDELETPASRKSVRRDANTLVTTPKH